MAEAFTWLIAFVISVIGASYIWDAIKKAMSVEDVVTKHLNNNAIKTSKDKLSKYEKAGINPDDYTLDDNKKSSDEDSEEDEEEPATIEAGEEETKDDSEESDDEDETEEDDDA